MANKDFYDNGEYHVVQFDKDGKRLTTISGLGRNEGTMDSSHSRRTAQHHAKQMREQDPESIYLAEPAHGYVDPHRLAAAVAAMK